MPDVKDVLPIRIDLKTANLPAQLAVFVFDEKGELLGTAPVEENEVKIDLKREDIPKMRVRLGGILPDPELKPTLEMMVRGGAPEVKLQWKEKGICKLQMPPRVIVPPWRVCDVPGHVYRTANGVDYPVFGARVHVYDVDPWLLLIPRLPDPILQRIREHLIELYDRPLFPREVMPRPRPDPHLRMREILELVSLNPQPEPPLPKILGSIFPAELTAALGTTSLVHLRQALLDHLNVVRPHLCLLPWLHSYFVKHEVANAITDADGRFNTSFLYCRFGDVPDLYFRVEYCLGGVWTTVYGPPVPCTTHWNYVSGTEITIRLTDVRVPVPAPIAGAEAVAVVSIGNGISTSELQRLAAGSKEGLTTDGEPLGGTLEPHVFFDHDALAAVGITHYRWSYRKIGTFDWHPLTRRVVRHYAVVTPMPFRVDFLPFLLGPDPAYAAPLFQIPPKDAPAGSAGWFVLDAREDMATGFFDSINAEGEGKYELKLELFKPSVSLAPVDLTAAGVQLFEANEVAPFGAGPVTTRKVADPAGPPGVDGDRIIRDPVSTHVMAYRLVVHVDNRACIAGIQDTVLEGRTSGPCGFLQYAAVDHDAKLSFTGWHPDKFATFSFTTTKGTSGAVAAASTPAGGYPRVDATGAPVNDFTCDAAGLHTKDVKVSVLLGTCPGAAAFAETLYVWAMATDGWRRLWEYDASAAAAFALQHAAPVPIIKTPGS